MRGSRQRDSVLGSRSSMCKGPMSVRKGHGYCKKGKKTWLELENKEVIVGNKVKKGHRNMEYTCNSDIAENICIEFI